jgi:hypothetical protein
MQFHAASIGSAIPQDNFNATIQSLFDSSLNLRLEHEDRLITILVSDHYELPQGIRVDKKIPIQSLTVGLRAASRGGILRFDSSPLTIDLRNAAIWDGRLPVLTGDFEQAWLIMWQTLNDGQRLKKTELIAEDLFRSDQGSLLTRKLSQPAHKLIASAKKFDSHACAEAAHEMIGLGPGVTPSGDDILIGFLAGLYSTACNQKDRLEFIQAFGNALFIFSKETNDISRTYIRHAVKGEFSSSIVALIEAIHDGDEGRLISVTKNAMQIGHSSGMDSITGLLIGLAAWGTASFYSNYKEMIL